MARIKYAVVGIEQNHLASLIGTLARGEVEGEADTVVLPAPVPVCYRITDSLTPGAATTAQEVPFGKYLGEAVTKERRRLVRASSASAGVNTSTEEKVIGEVVDLLTAKTKAKQEKG